MYSPRKEKVRTIRLMKTDKKRYDKYLKKMNSFIFSSNGPTWKQVCIVKDMVELMQRLRVSADYLKDLDREIKKGSK